MFIQSAGETIAHQLWWAIATLMIVRAWEKYIRENAECAGKVPLRYKGMHNSFSNVNIPF